MKVAYEVFLPLLLLCFFCTSAKKTFRLGVLKEHNRLRALHGAPPLMFDPQLNGYAEEHAKFLAKKQVLRHSNRQYGENLYKVTSPPANGVTVSRMWYRGINKYNFSAPGFSPATEEATQMLWNSTKYIGVASAKSVNNKVYVVAMYSPKGNRPGRFPGNVLPRKSSTTPSTTSTTSTTTSTTPSTTTSSTTPTTTTSSSSTDSTTTSTTPSTTTSSTTPTTTTSSSSTDSTTTTTTTPASGVV